MSRQEDFEKASDDYVEGKPEWGAPTDKQVFIIKFKKGGEQ